MRIQKIRAGQPVFQQSACFFSKPAALRITSILSEHPTFQRNAAKPSHTTIYIAVSDIHLKACVFAHTNPRTPPDGQKFERFLQHLKVQAEKLPQETRLVLVLNGDILDILASWDGPPYPWQLGKHPAETEAKLQEALKKIVQHNNGVFQAFQKLLTCKNLEVHYITGNHDHWLRSPEEGQQTKAQQQIRAKMALPQDADKLYFHETEWKVPGVALFTHGHTIDRLSISSNSEASPWGDYVTLFLVNRYQVHLQQKLREAGYSEMRVQRLLLQLDELDHLPLFWDAPGWQKTLAKVGQPLGSLMQAAQQKAFEELINAAQEKLELVPDSWQGSWLSKLLNTPGRFHFISWIATMVEGWVHTNRSQKQFAHQQASSTYPNIVMGHSHAPHRQLMKLLSNTGEMAHYLNSGSWKRTFIPPNSLNRFLPHRRSTDPKPYSRYVQIIQTPNGFLSATLQAYDPDTPATFPLQGISHHQPGV